MRNIGHVGNDIGRGVSAEFNIAFHTKICTHCQKMQAEARYRQILVSKEFLIFKMPIVGFYVKLTE